MIRGLAGIVSTTGEPLAASPVVSMLAAMGARSDRLQGIYRSATAALAIGAPVDGRWNVEIQGDRLTIADLRLDERAALAQRLDCSDVDDEVAARAVARWGVKSPEHLHGDFALASWNPEIEELFIARDRFGVRPLVYTSGNGWFAFASEAKALLSLAATRRDSSELRIAEFLAGQMPAADVTMFDAIHRLPAGHRMTIRGSSIQCEPYWQWSLPPVADSSDLSGTLAETFTRAVRRRVPVDRPTAVTLSGGLDSSSVAATMAKIGGGEGAPVKTYSLVFDRHPHLSERRYIESLTSQGGYEPHFLDLDLEDPFEGFSDLLARQDGLFFTPGLAMGRSLLEGLPRGAVVLDGHGGDEVISDGYERLHELAEQGRWLQLLNEAVGASRITGSAPLMVLASYYALYGRGGWRLRNLLRSVIRRGNAGNSATSALSARLASKLEAAKADKADAGSPDARSRHLDMLKFPGQQHVLEVLDRDAAGRGHEARSPFWDADLIAFTLSVPAREKLKGGRPRRILREAMADRLPDAIRWRRDKHDFNHHMVRGLKVSPAASADRFDRQADRLSRYIALDVVAAARDRIMAAGDAASGSDVNTLWRATAVAEWLDYADRNGIRIVE